MSPRSLPAPSIRAVHVTAFALAALLSTLSTAAQAQASWRNHADLTRAREAVDSFTVTVGERTMGWQRLGWVREGQTHTVGLVIGSWKPLAKTVGTTTWIMSDEVALNGVTQRSEVRFSSALQELGLRQQGQMGTTAMRIELDREKERMTGSALTPSGGAAPVPMNVTVPDDVIDDNALSVILPLVKWSTGLTFTVPVLSSGKGTVDTFTGSVVDQRTVNVPAGSFAVWHVLLAGPRYTLEADVTTTAPYRVVKFGPRGAPMSSVLVSSRATR